MNLNDSKEGHIGGFGGGKKREKYNGTNISVSCKKCIFSQFFSHMTVVSFFINVVVSYSPL